MTQAVKDLRGCGHARMDATKLQKVYYSPGGYWKGLAAIKKLASAAKVSEDVARDWLKKQAIWQIKPSRWLQKRPEKLPMPSSASTSEGL